MSDDLDERAHPKLQRAESLARRLDKPLGILGVVFLLVVLAQLLATDPALLTVLAVTSWVFWVIFVAEFVLRAHVAGYAPAFWKRNWWQVLFLLVPFLRFFRALQAFRALRVARIATFGGAITAGVRGTRSAGRLLGSRLGWLVALTAVVILVSSQLLYIAGSQESYAIALHQAALATIVGQPLDASGLFARILEVILAVYSVAVFATLAGTIGAYFLADRGSHAAVEPVVEPVVERVPSEDQPA
jgi:voltage-gated potassium channel